MAGGRTYHIVWNIDPLESVDYIKFFLIRERDYRDIGGTAEYYDPRVQMEKKVSLWNRSYGALALPKNWTVFMKEFIEVELDKKQGLFDQLFPEQYRYFGWNPYDANRKEIFPESAVNGSRYINGDIDLEIISILSEIDLENP
ncbi:hypothetical protein [Cytobacillus sp. NCCP-133]|uniref:hypothetical protein n=1 Tax=Cytobacillus sp. NCCP-133 TaxID=766848 RepID=UPI00222E352B|nr:hypothetical protein [Cytobacillus sp. NCCP-133]GLB59899.1 hypothetical protein NCCP133_20310 [Cytobacillus sp. NCCP-133]